VYCLVCRFDLVSFLIHNPATFNTFPPAKYWNYAHLGMVLMFSICPLKPGQAHYPPDTAAVRGTPYASDARSSSASASDSCLPSASAPATSSLFRNAFGRMTSYATRSWPASAPDRMMSQDSSSRPDISSRHLFRPAFRLWHVDTTRMPYLTRIS